jgi:ribosomal protein S16
LSVGIRLGSAGSKQNNFHRCLAHSQRPCDGRPVRLL